MAVNNSLSTNNSWFPNGVGNPVPENPAIDRWFSLAAFAAPAPDAFGKMGRNIINGPGLIAVNLSLARSEHFFPGLLLLNDPPDVF
jgi:hypothetical protein